MSRELLVVVAGIPPIADRFTNVFTQRTKDEHVRRFTWLTLDWSTSYNETYAIALYNRLADHLPKLGERIPEDLNLVLLYFDKCDGSHRYLIEQFGVEALVLPIAIPNTPSSLLDTRNQRNRFVNAMIRNIRQALNPVQALLNVVNREVTSGDRTTWLLLPPKTFGDDIQKNIARAHAAARRGASDFREEIKRVYRSIPRSKYYQSRGCEFRPADRHARHGVPPSWKEHGHRPSCVIRGRLRLGVPYDPGFHYDCIIPGGSSREFPGCHAPVTIRGRTYVNVAPNDHVR